MKSVKLLVILLAGLLRLATAYFVISAINAGGRAFYDTDGISFVDDTNFTGGLQDTWAYNLDLGRINEKNRPIYSTYRYGASEFSYTLPVWGDGLYYLILKFGDSTSASAGINVFNVSLNSDVALANLDIYAQRGNHVHDELILFEVCDGGSTLVRDFRAVELHNNTVRLTFTPVKGLAIIDGILLLHDRPGLAVILFASTIPFPFYFPKETQCAPNATTVRPVITTTMLTTTTTTTTTTITSTASTTSSEISPTLSTENPWESLTPNVTSLWQKLLLFVQSINVQSNNTIINVNFYGDQNST